MFAFKKKTLPYEPGLVWRETRRIRQRLSSNEISQEVAEEEMSNLRKAIREGNLSDYEEIWKNELPSQARPT